VLALLQAGRGCNAERLAEECEVSRRTIFRDLDVLRSSGLALVYDEVEQHYRLPGAQFLPPFNLTPDEAISLILLCHEMGGRARMPFLASAQNASLKLESVLPGRLRHEVHAAIDSIQIKMPPANPLSGQEPIYERLVEAVRRRRCVRIRYTAPTEEGTFSTKLGPYRLLFSRRSWYVIGRSSLHRGVRTFNIGRIADLEPLEDEFTVPRGFSVERYLRNAWHLIPEPGPDQDVVVRFSKLVAQNVAEVTWHKRQRLEFNADGTLDFHVTVSGLKEISWWILGYGDQAEVIRPPELRRIVAGHAKRMARLYEARAEEGSVD
jgi:predicted DNA-binding transcriptional regulator YafY